MSPSQPSKMVKLLAALLLAFALTLPASADEAAGLVGVWRFVQEVDTYVAGTPFPGPPGSWHGL